MSHKAESAAVIIERRHQSAPAATPLDRAVQQAAEEIDGGRYIADDGASGEAALDGLGLALGMGSSGAAVGEKPTLDDFQTTRELNQIGRHPRVLEAIAELERQVAETAAASPQEALEREWRLYEMTCLQVADQKWEGQQRWEGKDNEDMRLGKLLTPIQFHEQLCTAIGRERVLLSPHAVKENPDDKSARCGLYVKNPEWKGESPVIEYKQVKAAEIRKGGLSNLQLARQYRKAGLNALADKTFEMAGDAAQAAAEMLMEMSAERQTTPELLRVGTLQWPLGTEWMVMHFNEYGVPTSAKYLGWRTALLTMVRCRVITEEEAHQAFPVGSGPAAGWYLEQLYRIRNPKGQVVQ
jgi:hypothetical protein